MVSHCLLFLRVEWLDTDDNYLEIECMDCAYIKALTTWDDCHLKIRAHIEQDTLFFTVYDDDAGIEIRCADVFTRVLSESAELCRIRPEQ